MTKGNKRITFEERQQIEKLIKTGATCAFMAKQLGRSVNGIASEIRHLKKENYEAEKAHAMAEERSKRTKKSVFIDKGMTDQRIENLEMQVEILHDTIKDILKRVNLYD